ncbi:MAG: hypothetical protein U0573_05620 [Phycisphaerales bacterium]|nr:hypothetical protein [Planctomycetota bacterium]
MKFVALPLAAGMCTSAIAQCGAQWLSGLQSPDLTATPSSAVEWDPDGAGPRPSVIVVGGPFTKAGTLAVNNLASWNGTNWEKPQGSVQFLGSSLQSPTLFAFASDLYAIDNARVYRWNGAGWTELLGLSGARRLALFNGSLVALGDLIIGGQSHWVARLDGSAWTPIDPPLRTGFTHILNDLIVVSGQLMISGRFFFTSAASATSFATFDGANWTNGPSLPFTQIAEQFCAADNALFVGSSAGIYQQTGQTWTILAAPLGSDLLLAKSPGGKLCASFKAGSSPVYEWDGAGWQTIGSASPNGTSTPLGLVSTRFGLLAFGTYVTRVSIYNGDNWGPVSESFGGIISALGHSDGSLIAGQGFRGLTSSSFVATDARIATWDGQRFRTIGAAPRMPASVPNASPVVISFTQVDAHTLSTGVFGEFKHSAAGGLLDILPSGEIQALSPSLQYADPTVSPAVYAVVDFQNRLHAIGRFTASGDQPLSNIARLTESGWEWPDAGLAPSSPQSPATAAIVFNNELIVSGAFTAAGEVAATNVARWDGEYWHEMGTLPSALSAFAIYNNELYGAGKLTISGVSYELVKWTGSQWQPIPGPVQGTGYALLNYQGNLIIGGETTAGAIILHKWNGTTLSEFVTGLKPSGKVYALAEDHNELVVGGDITLTVNSIPSNFLARWSPDGIPWIAQQPEPAAANCGRTLAFSAAPAIGYTKYTKFQWRRNGTNLANGVSPSGSIISGATTLSLSVANVSPADTGNYDCVISSTTPSCPAVTTQPALASVSCCPSDFNGDLLIDDADFQIFIVAYNILECPPVCPADLNHDNAVDDADFQLFVPAYNSLICE